MTEDETVPATSPTQAAAPTKAEIDAARTPAGGWTKEQLAAWGVPWPPPKGWRKELERQAPAEPGDEAYAQAVSALLVAMATNAMIEDHEADTLVNSMPDDLRDALRMALCDFCLNEASVRWGMGA